MLRDPNDLGSGEAMLVDWTAEQYHADPDTTSRSQLMDLRVHGPAYYHARHGARTLPPEKPGAPMVFGTHVHLALFEPHEWARRVSEPAPERPAGADGRKKADTPERKAFVQWQIDCAQWEAALQPDSIVMGAEERAKVEACARALAEHDDCRRLLTGPGANEQTVVWREPETGVLVRVRPDRVVELDADTLVSFDGKTTTDPRPDRFSESMLKYGYHMQAAMCIDALAALRPGADVHFVFGVVRSRAVYEAGCFEPYPRDVDLGRRHYMEALRELARRRAENDWIAEWQRGIRGIGLPERAHRKAEETPT